MVCDDIKIKPLQRQKVCVIGAGMAGLASARELRREGHDVSVLEQSGDVGGQWLYDPRVDDDDPLGAGAAPVKVHSSMYASLRLISARENMGFTDFQFATKDGRDGRRFPGHREVYLYLKDFCDAFGLMESVRLNTSVVRVALAPGPTRQWTVRSVDLGKRDGAEEQQEEEVFDAVVVANGHYSQPRLPSIEGMEAWRGRQIHSHSYRVPEPFRDEVVVVVGCGESGKDIAMEVRRVAKEVHLVAKSIEEVTQGLAKVLAKHSASLHLQLHVERLCDDGRVVFGDGSTVLADTIIYCTGYDYSFSFLDTEGAVTVDDNRVGPLFEHVFPPSLAPSLSFIGIPIKVFAPWFFEAQARWVAQVLSGKRTLPPEEEMMRSVEEHYHGREIAGAPKKYTHDVSLFDITLQGYTDADWQGDLDERKSTSGCLFTLAGGAISWKSKKQTSVAQSSMEAEYIAANEAVKDGVWLRDFLVSLEIIDSASGPVTVYCDNQAAIKLSRDPKFHSKARHIEGKYHYIRDVINRLKTVRLEFLPGTDMLADPLTKLLSQELFCKHVRNMGLRIF